MRPVLSHAIILTVASLSVRKIDEELYERLRVRAAQHGVSMEEEVRQILKRVVTAPERLGDLALDHFGRDGVDLELPPRETHGPIDVGT
jgi:plasmid stability protein